METTVNTEFGNTELKVIYAALDHYYEYVTDYAEGYPVLGNGGADLHWVLGRIKETKDRIEEIIALKKAFQGAIY